MLKLLTIIFLISVFYKITKSAKIDIKLSINEDKVIDYHKSINKEE